MRHMAAVALVLPVSLLVLGCGSDDDSTTVRGTAAPAPRGSGAGPGEGRGSTAQIDDTDRGASSSEDGNVVSESPEETLERARREFRLKPGADNSIQEFGVEQSGETRREVVGAMYAFFRAVADSDHTAICNRLTRANVEQLEHFLKLKDKQGGCETVLEEVLTSQAPEAKRAASGIVYEVREEDGNAFVLFVPEGGVASYFVMKNENGAWKSTSVTTGTPLNPGAPIGE